jgi:hypothetical protein
MSTGDRFGEKPSPWPKLAMAVIILGFVLSLLNQFYLLDAIYHRVTGEHNPALFRQAPGAQK